MREPMTTRPARGDAEIGAEILADVAARAARRKGPCFVDVFAPAIGRLSLAFARAIPETERPALSKDDLEQGATWLLLHGAGTAEVRQKLATSLDELIVWRHTLQITAAYEVGRAVGEARARRGKAPAPIGK